MNLPHNYFAVFFGEIRFAKKCKLCINCSAVLEHTCFHSECAHLVYEQNKCKMLYQEKTIVAGIIWVLLLIICPSSSAIDTISVFKCCETSDKFLETNPVFNLSTPINIDNKDLITKNITSSSISNQTVLFSSKAKYEVTNCHPNENSLTSTFSFRPNTLDKGFYSSGYLRNGDQLLSPNQYCIITKSADNEYMVKSQPSTFCNENHCIRKCCSPLEVYDLSTYGISKLQCVSSADNPWSPTLYPPKEGFENASNINFFSEYPKPWCQNDVVLWSLRTIGTYRRSLFRIFGNGSIIKRDGMTWEEMDTSRLCIDGAINIPGYFDHNARQSLFSGDELDTVILECGPELKEEGNPPLVLYGVALAVSTVFQFATLVVYGLLWDKQNIHGWTLLGYITTMFLFYISLLATFFYSYNYPDPDFVSEKEIFNSFCGIIAVVSHFLYICTTCWLSVISADIFLTFRILKLTRSKSKNKLKFFLYLIFTLFVPSVIVCVGVLLDINYGDDPEVNITIPRYGWNKCFLDLRQAALPYLFGPIGVLLLLNCFMYCATIFHMYQLQESTKFASANSSQVQKQRAKIRMFSKLFLLMGCSWILELITYLAFGDGANVPVIIGDMVNILQPVAIFFIFVCKRDIMKSLAEKYSFVTKVFSSFEPEESITSSSSTRAPKLTKLWNPVAKTKWFRSRINSTMTDISNLSNQSIRSISINAIDESPSLDTSSPLNMELEASS